MYFPYLRGRQFELIALRELNDNGLMSSKIIPIVEPVKASSTLIKTLNCYFEKKTLLAIVHNPQVGDFKENLVKEDNSKIKDSYYALLKEENFIIAHQLNTNSENEINRLEQNKILRENIITICCDEDSIDIYKTIFDIKKPQYSLIPDESVFRHNIRDNRIMLKDRYNKQERNKDYADQEDEVFSHDHLYYSEDGYKGFSDYSVIGDEYVESGFAPRAVVIHIVYFDKEKVLRIHHFVSDSNDDISDPAGKFEEALTKLIDWNKTSKLDTYALREFKKLFNDKKYPGLGTVKKLSIMHHLELMSLYLDSLPEG